MPTRYLKQGICDSDSINALSDSAECLFYRLLVTADDYGRADGRPLVVKSKCYPIKESVTVKSIEKCLSELEQHGVIVRYEVDGKPYLQLQKWDSKPRAGKSKFPQPPYIYVQQNTDARNCMQENADEKQPHTLLPVTVTETETDLCTQTSDDVANENLKTVSVAFNAMRWLTDNGVSENHARDWLKVRKAKRAANTETAFALALSEAESIGWTMAQAVEHMAANAWQGFKADWVKGKSPPGGAEKTEPDLVTVANGQAVPRDFLVRVGLMSQ